ncbi:hypothetical protein HYPDE_23123 [Hyphomicrobium denitrificans 1NES1]|uniref:Transmembrane protein n=1 Tax=Hyphomicrobium denitrificans 1NES1 TaxID=670307 RepID=N0B6Y9_9HYPH|nr:hypothetical protein [Hyphomicrobium denitrificans]AGK56311.1 hypothetical protein HYPDE_23123 [Hyphomicrobium denitrificans 1NES1]
MSRNLLIQLGRWTPLLLVVGYIALTYGLFLFGPVEWNVPNIWRVSYFMAVCVAMLTAGYAFGLRHVREELRSIPWRPFFWIGTIASGALLFPSAWIYMSKWPWDAVQLARCQNIAYMDMINNIRDDVTGYRYLYVIVRALFAPFAFCVLPLTVLHWSQMRWREYGLLAVYLLSALCMSLLRGTDKEIADIVIVLLATVPIVAFRVLISRDLPLSRLVGLLLATVLIIGAGAYLFAERREARIFRSLPTVAQSQKADNCRAGDWRCMCEAESSLRHADARSPVKPPQEICTANCVKNSEQALSERPLSEQALPAKPKEGGFLAYMATSYLSQGYYGMALAMTQDFSSTYGLGHSPLLLYYSRHFLGEDFANRAYVNKIADRWDPKGKWSTAMTWWANDVSFYGVPFVFALLGMLTACCWREATEQQRDAAAILFVLCMFLFFYLPANNQLFMTADSGMIVLFWLVLWGLNAIPRRREYKVPHVCK